MSEILSDIQVLIEVIARRGPVLRATSLMKEEDKRGKDCENPAQPPQIENFLLLQGAGGHVALARL